MIKIPPATVRQQILKELAAFAWIVVAGTIVYQFVAIPRRIDEAVNRALIPVVNAQSARVNAILGNVEDITNTTKILLHEVSHDYYDPKNDDQGFYWDIKNVLDRSSESSFATARFVARLDAQINGGADPTTGLQVRGTIPTATGLLEGLKQVADGARKDLETTDGLIKSIDGSIVPLNTTLIHISSLASELEGQLATGGDVATTLRKLSTTVGDFNTLLEDPDIKTVISETAKGATSLAGSAETLDIVMRPWRKKANQLKAILIKLGQMIKVVVPLPF